MRILIIEDEKKVADFISNGLAEEGYAVDVAHDGDQGYFLATTNEYDAILLDIMLPKMDGFTLCTKLRYEDNHTPILMLTAKDAIKDKVRGLERVGLIISQNPLPLKSFWHGSGRCSARNPCSRKPGFRWTTWYWIQ